MGKPKTLNIDYLKWSMNQSTSFTSFTVQLMVLVRYVKQGNNNHVFQLYITKISLNFNKGVSRSTEGTLKVTPAGHSYTNRVQSLAVACTLWKVVTAGMESGLLYKPGVSFCGTLAFCD